MKEFMHFDKMDAYARHVMTEAERQAFEQALETDPELRAEWEAFQEMVAGVQAAGDLALRQTIAGVHQKMKANAFPEEKEKIRPFGRRTIPLRWILTAAAVVVLALGIWWLQQPNLYEKTYAAHFIPEKKRLSETLDALESSGYAMPETSKTLRTGLQAYEKGDYAQSIADLQQYLSESGPQADDAAFFYLGICHMEQGDFEEATTPLEKLADQLGSPWQQDAEYYLGLALLNTTEVERAIALFEKMAADVLHPYHTEAFQILENMPK